MNTEKTNSGYVVLSDVNKLIECISTETDGTLLFILGNELKKGHSYTEDEIIKLLQMYIVIRKTTRTSHISIICEKGLSISLDANNVLHPVYKEHIMRILEKLSLEEISIIMPYVTRTLDSIRQVVSLLRSCEELFGVSKNFNEQNFYLDIMNNKNIFLNENIILSNLEILYMLLRAGILKNFYKLSDFFEIHENSMNDRW